MCVFQMESNFWNLCSLTVIQIILNYIEEFVNFKHPSNSNLLALTSTRPEVLINKEKKPMKPSILNSEAQNQVKSERINQVCLCNLSLGKKWPNAIRIKIQMNLDWFPTVRGVERKLELMQMVQMDFAFVVQHLVEI